VSELRNRAIRALVARSEMRLRDLRRLQRHQVSGTADRVRLRLRRGGTIVVVVLDPESSRALLAYLESEPPLFGNDFLFPGRRCAPVSERHFRRLAGGRQP